MIESNEDSSMNLHLDGNNKSSLSKKNRREEIKVILKSVCFRTEPSFDEYY